MILDNASIPQHFRTWYRKHSQKYIETRLGSTLKSHALQTPAAKSWIKAALRWMLLNNRFSHWKCPLNKACAISCTGSGEFFIRGVAAYDVACLIEHKGLSLQAAAEEVIHKRILEINGDGGLIAVDIKGNIAMPFNTQQMFRACVSSNRALEVYN